LPKALEEFDENNLLTKENLDRGIGNVFTAVQNILKDVVEFGTSLDERNYARYITTQAMGLLKANPEHPHLDWNDILQPDSPQKNPQPRANPPTTPSQKGFFDITPSTANRIGMFGISVFIFEIALALCSSALNTPTGEQVAIFTSNPMFIVVNAIAFAATAFYKAIPETSSGIPNL
jgi:hypothetical protein